MFCCKLWSRGMGIQLKQTRTLTSLTWCELFLVMMCCQRDLLNWPLLHWLSSIATTVRKPSEWHFLQRLDAIKGNKTIHVDTCELCKQESDPTIHTPWRHFSLSPQAWFLDYWNVPGSTTGCLLAIRRHVLIYHKHVLQNPRSFFLCKYPGDKLNAQINKQNECTWIFIILWQSKGGESDWWK